MYRFADLAADIDQQHRRRRHNLLQQHNIPQMDRPQRRRCNSHKSEFNQHPNRRLRVLSWSRASDRQLSSTQQHIRDHRKHNSPEDRNPRDRLGCVHQDLDRRLQRLHSEWWGRRHRLCFQSDIRGLHPRQHQRCLCHYAVYQL